MPIPNANNRFICPFRTQIIKYSKSHSTHAIEQILDYCTFRRGRTEHADTALAHIRRYSSDFRHVAKGHNHIYLTRNYITMFAEGFYPCFVLIIFLASLTVASTILVGRRCWEGWLLAGVNSVIICVIGLRTAQLGFIPANVFCMVMSAINLRAWRRSGSY